MSDSFSIQRLIFHSNLYGECAFHIHQSINLPQIIPVYILLTFIHTHHTRTHTLQAVGVPSRLTFLYYLGDVLYPFGPIPMCIWRGQVIYWDKTASFKDRPLFSWLIILLICATFHATPLSARCWWILEAYAEHLLCARFLRHQNDLHLQRASHLVDRHLSMISTLQDKHSNWGMCEL